MSNILLFFYSSSFTDNVIIFVLQLEVVKKDVEELGAESS